MTGTGVLAVLASTAFLVGSRADVDKPAADPLTATAEPQPPAARTGTSERAKKRPARTSAPRRSSGVPPSARRFAWPTVVGATGYHVELFRGSALVFRAKTTRPQILIPVRWRRGVSRYRLSPGDYRWYVWPLVDGQRKATAIVQAKLVVPR